MRSKPLILFLLLFFCCGGTIFAQKKSNKKQRDTVNTRGDTTSVLVPFKPQSEQPKAKIYHPDSTHLPHTAIMKSLIVPGLGQIYNKQYWKLPIVYGGFAGLAYSFIVAQTNYKEYLKVATALQRGQTVEEKYRVYTAAQITPYVDFYNRNRSLTIIGTVAFWGIQAIDAYIAAKFQHSYTMDNDLGFKVSPTVINSPAFAYRSFTPGLKLTWKVR